MPGSLRQAQGRRTGSGSDSGSGSGFTPRTLPLDAFHLLGILSLSKDVPA